MSVKFPSLSTREAEKRLAGEGLNRLSSPKKKSRIAVFFGQYKDIMTCILLCCTVLSFLMGEYAEAVSIAVIVLLNGILGFTQEYRTEKTLEALKALSAPEASLFRDGKPVRIPAERLVRGDLLILNTGDRIPADALLIEGTAVECDESILTGESLPVSKISAPDSPIPDKLGEKRLLYAGCTITGGHGLARIIETGAQTQMGKIAGLLNDPVREESPLSRRLDKMGKLIAAGCIMVCFIVTLCGILRGEDLFEMLLTGVSLAVAAVPEGLAAIVTISLAISVSRMKQQHALVRRLHAVETLGCASVICTDKTGTLTENKMKAEFLFTPAGGISETGKNSLSSDEKKLLSAAFFCCREEFAADPTEKAILTCCQKHLPALPRPVVLQELPFDSSRKRMSVLVRENGKTIQYTKGAPDRLLPLCTDVYENGQVRPLTPSLRQKAEEQLAGLGEKGLRCLAAAYRESSSLAEERLIFLGLLACSDPPRRGVKQAVRSCRNAGIIVCMVTGDHPATAARIAAETGILRPGERLMTGTELSELSEAELRREIGSVRVFCRVSPSDKLKIISAYRKNGLVCAMTGDGVNDAPALRQADIGVSMGKNGTDAAREASDMVLLDDDFSTLTEAVRCGRGVYANIRKFLRYLLSCNIGEVLTMFLGILFSFPVVLLPLQILLVNLATDGLPAIALSLEPTDPAVMTQKPRPLQESLFSDGLGLKIILRGIFIGLSTLLSFWLIRKLTGSLEAARTAALITLVLAQLIHVFECKSETGGLFSVRYGNNIPLIGAVLLSLAVLLLAVFLPAAATLFGLTALSAGHFALACLAAATVPLLCSLFQIKFRR